MQKPSYPPPKEHKELFRRNRLNALHRGIEWKLTFGQWYLIWLTSDKFNQRGRGTGKYCMARFGDEGPYAHGNVKIITNGENTLEMYARCGLKIISSMQTKEACLRRKWGVIRSYKEKAKAKLAAGRK